MSVTCSEGSDELEVTAAKMLRGVADMLFSRILCDLRGREGVFVVVVATLSNKMLFLLCLFLEDIGAFLRKPLDMLLCFSLLLVSRCSNMKRMTAEEVPASHCRGLVGPRGGYSASAGWA